METKRWWQSKTIWIGILEVLIGVGGLVAEFLKVGDYTSASVSLLVTGVMTVILRKITTTTVT